MITIKIKTWKDYKKDFINWVQAPRRKTCKEYVRYMESVSQQLVGERLAEEAYKQKAEENMMNLVKEAQESKKKIILSAMVAVLSLVAAVPLILISGLIELAVWTRILLNGIALTVIAAGIIIACILDRDAGAYECPHCHSRFVPEMGEYIMGAHTLTKRKLRCPSCGKKSYCQKRLTK